MIQIQPLPPVVRLMRWQCQQQSHKCTYITNWWIWHVNPSKASRCYLGITRSQTQNGWQRWDSNLHHQHGSNSTTTTSEVNLNTLWYQVWHFVRSILTLLSFRFGLPNRKETHVEMHTSLFSTISTKYVVKVAFQINIKRTKYTAVKINMHETVNCLHDW